MNETDASDINDQKHDGWTLYYTEDNYPYYYNEYTNESVWAEVPENSVIDQETKTNDIAEPFDNGSFIVEEDSDSVSHGSSSLSENESETSSDEIDDDEFKDFLQSSSGITEKKVFLFFALNSLS